MIWSPAITAVLIGVIAVFSFGGGFSLADWRKSGQLERLKGDNALLSAANDRCAADIEKARIAVDGMVAAAKQREKQAADSMKEAQPQVERRRAVITRIRALPKVAPDMQCEAIKQEQIQYVQVRRSDGND